MLVIMVDARGGFKPCHLVLSAKAAPSRPLIDLR
jgi:hypothetical protein